MSFAGIWRRFLLTILCLSCIVRADTVDSYCIRHSNTQRKYSAVGKCSTVATTNTTPKKRPISVAISDHFNGTNTQDNTMQNMIEIDLICLADSDVCNKVEATMAKASTIITSAFRLETPLRVNASYFSFCEYMDCLDSSNQASIAETFPTVSFLMVDLSDNMTRMYAQPLLKQFGNLTAKPAWSRYDIEAQFNSETNWYYPTDDGPIGSNQIDFLGNVIHELIHGLGLMTSWGDIFFRHLAPLFPDNVLEYFITPSLLASMDKAQSLNDYSSSQPFWGFVEFAFDKFLAYKTKRFNTTDGSFHSLSSTTTRLNKFAQSNTLFRTAVDFANAWYHSESYEHAKRAYGRAVTALEISAIVNNEPIFWMETSLDPFSPGSSLCHVDQSQYANTSDYLMIYSAQQGISSTSLTTRYPYGPIGPRLAKMMAALGYRMDPKYAATTIRPQLRFWSPPLQLVGTESNPSPTAAIDRSGPARLPPTASAGTDPTALAGVSPTKSDALSLHFSIYHWFIASLTTIITIFYL